MTAGRTPLTAADSAAATVLGVKLLGVFAVLLAPLLPQEALAAALCELLLYVLRIGLPLVLAVALAKLPPNPPPRRSFPPVDRVLLPLAAVGLGLCANSLFSAVADALARRGFAFSSPAPVFAAGGAALAVEALAWTLFPAILEELLFRGYITSLLLRYGNAAALFWPALFFALCHNTPAQLLPAFVMGLCLGWLRIASGSVLLPILTHLLYNCVALLSALWGGAAIFTTLFAVIAVVVVILRNGTFSLPRETPAVQRPVSRSPVVWLCLAALLWDLIF